MGYYSAKDARKSKRRSKMKAMNAVGKDIGKKRKMKIEIEKERLKKMVEASPYITSMLQDENERRKH